MRDIQKDLELCEKATPGPWTFSIEKSNSPFDSDLGSIEGETIVCSFGDDTKYYPTSGEAPEENDLNFILESREALPYYIKRCMELKEHLQVLTEHVRVWANDEDGIPEEMYEDWMKAIKVLEEQSNA